MQNSTVEEVVYLDRTSNGRETPERTFPKRETNPSPLSERRASTTERWSIFMLPGKGSVSHQNHISRKRDLKVLLHMPELILLES